MMAPQLVAAAMGALALVAEARAPATAAELLWQSRAGCATLPAERPNDLIWFAEVRSSARTAGTSLQCQ